MDQNFFTVQNINLKINYIKLCAVKLYPNDLINVYKHIHRQNDALQLLETALEKNLGGIFPDRLIYQSDYSDQAFKEITEHVEDFNQLSLYVKYAKEACRTESLPSLFKQISFVSEKIIRNNKSQNNLFKKLKLDQELVIHMITTLYPAYESYSQELFEHMLLNFEKVTNYSLLEELAESLINHCNNSSKNYNANSSQHQFWLILLTKILDNCEENQTMGVHILLKAITKKKLLELIDNFKNFILVYYFSKSNKAVQIFNGLTKFCINSDSIAFIKAIIEIIVQYIQISKSKNYSIVLSKIYTDFIQKSIIQSLIINCDNYDLLEYCIIGMCQIIPLEDNVLKNIFGAITFMLQFKSIDKQFLKSICQLLTSIQKVYQNLSQNKQLITLLNESTRQCSEFYYKQQYSEWNFSQLNDLRDEQLLERESTLYVGLQNLGNTCYMNSLLQCLYGTINFRKFILRHSEETNNLQFQLVRKLFMFLTFQNDGNYSPYQLRKSLRDPYGNYNQQQDVGEFAHHFLEDLQKQLTREESKILEEMFYGFQRPHIEYSNCKDAIFKDKEQFLGLDLHFSLQESSQDQEDIYKMIKKLYDPEIITIQAVCDKCQTTSDYIKKETTLMVLPPILILTIQRFTFDQATGGMAKILKKVPFRFEIDMREVFQQSHLNKLDSCYFLYAFIVHMGRFNNSGHYICYVRSEETPETWIEFDDTQITKKQLFNNNNLSADLIEEATPYMLFYKNKSQSPLILNQ